MPKKKSSSDLAALAVAVPVGAGLVAWELWGKKRAAPAPSPTPSPNPDPSPVPTPEPTPEPVPPPQGSYAKGLQVRENNVQAVKDEIARYEKRSAAGGYVDQRGLDRLRVRLKNMEAGLESYRNSPSAKRSADAFDAGTQRRGPLDLPGEPTGVWQDPITPSPPMPEPTPPTGNDGSGWLDVVKVPFEPLVLPGSGTSGSTIGRGYIKGVKAGVEELWVDAVRSIAGIGGIASGIAGQVGEWASKSEAQKQEYRDLDRNVKHWWDDQVGKARKDPWGAKILNPLEWF